MDKRFGKEYRKFKKRVKDRGYELSEEDMRNIWILETHNAELQGAEPLAEMLENLDLYVIRNLAEDYVQQVADGTWEDPKEIIECSYDTEIKLEDHDVYSAIPGDGNRVIIFLQRKGIPYREIDWNYAIDHHLPVSAPFHGGMMRGCTILSRVPQEEITRIAEEVEHLFIEEIASWEAWYKYMPCLFDENDERLIKK